MPKLDAEEIGQLLLPYLHAEPTLAFCEKVQRYVALLEVWNKKLNLTAVREPAAMVQRHFGESFYLGRLLPEFVTLLDVGSGAGFPGLPIALLYPEAAVTLAEAQVRKAVFLREAVWMTGGKAKVWAQRVEEMPAADRFEVVVLRAVDNMQDALLAAMARLRPRGTLAFFTGESGSAQLPAAEWADVRTFAVPLSAGQIVLARLSASGKHKAV